MPKDIIPADLEWCRERLDPQDALFLREYDLQYKSLHRTGDLIRVWDVDNEDLWALIDFLNYYTDVTNYSQSNFVEDPQIEEQIFEGKYRQAFVRTDTTGGSTRIIQVLRKGYLEELDWDEARWGSFNRVISGNDTSDPNGDGSVLSKEQFYTARFIGVEPSVARAFASSLENGEVTDPVIDCETVSGTFGVVRFDHRVDDDDGSVTFEVLIADADYRVVSYANKNTPEEESVIYIYNVQKKDIHTITDEFSSETNVTVRLSEEKRGGFFDVVVTKKPEDISDSITSLTTAIECGEEAEVTNFYWGVEESDIVDLSALALEPGWTARISGPNMRSDGLFNYSYSIRKNIPKNIDWYDSVRNTLLNEFEQKFIDYDANDVAAILFPENEQGVTISVDRRKKAGCLEDIEIRKRETTPHSVQHEFNTTYGTGTIYAAKYQRDLDDMPQGSENFSTSVNLSINDDETYNWVVISVPTNLIAEEYNYTSRASCGTVTATTYKGERVAVIPDYELILSNAGPGYTISVTRNNLNADGTYDYTYTLFKDPKRVDQDVEAISEQLRTVTVDRYYKHTADEAAAIVVPTSSIGTTVRFERSIDEACLRDVTVTETVVTEDKQRQVFNTRWGEGWIEVAKYQQDIANFPATSTDYNTSVTLSRNDDGTYNWVVLSVPYELRNSEFEYVSNRTELGELETSYEGRGVSASPDFSSIALLPGEVLRVRNYEVLPDGKYDYNYSISRNPTRTNTIDSVRQALRTVSELRLEDADDPASVPSPSAGQTVRASIQQRVDGLWDSVVSTESTSPESIEETFNTRFGEGRIYVAKYQTAIDLPEAEVGDSTSVNLNINDDGTYNWVVVVTPSDLDDTEFNYVSNKTDLGVIETTFEGKGVATPPDFSSIVLTAGQVLRVRSYEERPDGRFDYNYSISRSPTRTNTIDSVRQALRVVSEQRSQDADDPLDVPSPSAGESIRANIQQRVDGLWDSVISTESTTPESVSETFNTRYGEGKLYVAKYQPAIDLPETEVGKSTSISLNINDDGTYNWVVVITPSGVTDAEWDEETRESVFGTISTTSWGERVGARPVIPTPIDGQIVTVERLDLDSDDNGDEVWNYRYTVTENPARGVVSEWEDYYTDKKLINKDNQTLDQLGVDLGLINTGNAASVSVQRNQAGLYDYNIRIETPKAGGADAEESWSDGRGTTYVKWGRHKDAADLQDLIDNMPEGATASLSLSLDEYGKTNYSLTYRDGSYIRYVKSYAVDGGTRTITKAYNAEETILNSDLALITDDFNTAFDFSVNQQGKFDYTLIQTPKPNGAYQAKWDEYKILNLVKYERRYITHNGKAYYKDVKITYDEGQFDNFDDVADFINGGMHGTKYSRIGVDRYAARKVTNIEEDGYGGSGNVQDGWTSETLP